MLNAETLSPRVSSEDIRVRMRQKFKSNNRCCPSSPSLLFSYSPSSFLPPSLPHSPDSSLQLDPPRHLPSATSQALSYMIPTVSSMPMQTLWLMTLWLHSTARYVLPTSRGPPHTPHLYSESTDHNNVSTPVPWYLHINLFPLMCLFTMFCCLLMWFRVYCSTYVGGLWDGSVV